MIRCAACGRVVPVMRFCVECGNPLGAEYDAGRRGGQLSHFAAAPEERARSLAIVSTLFPRLPRAQKRVFRICLAAGVAVLVILGAIGLYPVALVVAAALFPVLVIGYLVVARIYGDEPLPVFAAAALWGAVAGAASSVALRALPVAPIGIDEPSIETLLVIGVAFPLVELALMIGGPLLLLPRHRFDDVLDGAAFGTASAVWFGGAQLLAQALPILGVSLSVPGNPLPWIIQLVELGVLQPIIAGSTIGALAAAFWLRYRAPVDDWRALGIVGQPRFAVYAAAGLLVTSGLARVWLTLIPATSVLLVLAVVSLIWLRRVIHVGLLQETPEMGATSSIDCPNCGQTTVERMFCGSCGVAIRALPRHTRVAT